MYLQKKIKDLQFETEEVFVRNGLQKISDFQVLSCIELSN